MQRKYSQGIKFVPNFQQLQMRRNNNLNSSNQKHSPVDIYKPNISPTVYNNSTYQQYLIPNNIGQENNLTRNSSFQGANQRRSLPNFIQKVDGVQVINSPVIDNRQRNDNNGFKSNFGLVNQINIPRRFNMPNVNNQPLNQISSPQNVSRSNLFQMNPTSYSVRKSMITTRNSPPKFGVLNRKNNQGVNLFATPANPTNINNSQPRNPNMTMPVLGRQNGRVCHSMIFSDSNSDQLYDKGSPPLSPLLSQNSNPPSMDLESTFSSDNYNSYGDLSSPLFSDQGSKTKKLEPNTSNRKKQQVWKSMTYSPIKTQHMTTKLQYQRPQNNNISYGLSNNNSLDIFKSKQEFNPTEIKRIGSQNDKQRKSYIQSKTELSQIGKQSSGSLSPQLKFKKKIDYNTISATSVNSPQHSKDYMQFLKPVQMNKVERIFTIDDFQIIEKLGRGTYGDVHLAREKRSKFVCVLKTLSKKKIKDLGIEQHVFRQIKIQTFLVHRHITSLYGVFDDQNKIYLIMQFMPDGNMATNGKKKITENQTAHLLHQVCQGIYFMHKQDIIHRDIKPQNLLLNNTYLKIGDFGCAVFGNTLRRTIVGCYAYISPQQFSNNPYDQKIDSWCIGTLAYELLTGKPPFEQKLRKAAIESKPKPDPDSPSSPTPESTIQFSQVQFPKDIKLSPEAIDFMKRLLDPDPITRADIKQALKHKFLHKAKQYQKYLESRL